MKIGIDCRTILNPSSGERAGVGHYTYYLVKNLITIDKRNQYVLFFDYRMRDTNEFRKKNVVIRHFPFSKYKAFLPFTYTHMLMSAYLLKYGLDLYHSPITSLPLTYPRKEVVTVHDLAIYKNPAWFPSQIFSTKLLVPQSLRKANAIIAVSQSTKKDLQDLFNVPSAKVSVIYEGVSTQRIKLKSRKDDIRRFKLGDKFILFVGTLEPRKNLGTLLRAYKKLITWDKKFSAYPLAIAGHKSYKSEDVFKEVSELKLGKAVRFLDYVTTNEKFDLMKKAACFINPSSYEGFGLTLVEAMALGCPVIASNVSSMPEIVGKAGVLINPEHEYEIAAALRKVLTDVRLRERLKKAGPKQAAQFSWEKCARETLVVYEKVGKKKS
ncbi:MAG: glycosyltransferase family 1 protein [Parcubacteria group bacterium]